MAASAAIAMADWTAVAVAMDRCLRALADFSKPYLATHGVPTLSSGSLLFLISVGDGGVRVSDMIRRGRLLGSNVSYALKSLESAGLIERSLDAEDRRNVQVRWTESGRSLALEIIAAGERSGSDAGSVLQAVERFENRFLISGS
jgi:DNA-binding MarR family transcriptional regulator